MLRDPVPESTLDEKRLFEQQQLALEASGTGLWSWDIVTDEVAWSPVCYALVGADPDGQPLTFQSFLERVHADDQIPLRDAVAACLANGSVFEHTFRVVHPDGSMRWLVNHGKAVYSAQGRPIRMLGSVRDITRQKEVQQRYEETQQHLSLALESSGLGIWTWDIPSGEVTWSDECYSIHGLPHGAFAGTVDAFAALVHPEDRERVLHTVHAAIAKRAPYVCEFRIVKPAGEVAWVSNRGRARYAGDGSPVSMVGTIGDITSLEQSATALHAALAASRTGTFQWNILTNSLVWDDELDRLFGLQPGSTVRSLEQFISLVHPDDRAEVLRACERCRDDGADFDLEYRVVLPDGGIRWLYDRGLTSRDAAGRPASMTGACVDITARVAADRALALNRSRLDYATRLSGVGFWYCDLPFDVLQWDDRVKEHFFFPSTAVVTIDDFYARIHAEDRAPTRAAIELSIASGRPYDITYRTVDPISGAVKWIRALGGTDYDGEGRPTHFDGVTVDVSAQRLDQQRLSLLNEKLQEQDRLKDRFIATLSHELRNPLAPILAAVKVMGASMATPGQVQRAQAIIERQSKQLSLLLDDLLDVARITQGKLRITRRTASLADVVDTAVEASRPALSGKNHRLSCRLPADPVSLEADPLRLSQVLTNLLTNAGKYSAPGSDIYLDAQVEDGSLVLAVRDEGIGIAADDIASVFEMFTQVDGESQMSDGGLGIGLALVKGLVELHGGAVEARSGGLGQGSEFIVRLPLSRPAAQSPAGPSATAAMPVPKRVLIMDDNEDAAVALSIVLELAGHEVRVTHSGQSALSLAPGFRPDAAVLDIGMPDMSGYEVAKRLRAEPWARDVHLIALTGWGQDRDRRRAFESGFDHHLSKPIDPSRLEDLIRTGVPLQAQNLEVT